MIDRYRRWFTYERDAHAKVLASLESVPVAGRSQQAYHQAIDLFAHMVRARHLWLHRLGGIDRGPGEVFPKQVKLGDVRVEADRLNATWDGYLAILENTALERSFEYRSLEGSRFTNRVEDILTQLFGHSWYHRGQIALLVRSLGGEPAITDFVFWTREALEG